MFLLFISFVCACVSPFARALAVLLILLLVLHWVSATVFNRLLFRCTLLEWGTMLLGLTLFGIPSCSLCPLCALCVVLKTFFLGTTFFKLNFSLFVLFHPLTCSFWNLSLLIVSKRNSLSSHRMQCARNNAMFKCRGCLQIQFLTGIAFSNCNSFLLPKVVSSFWGLSFGCVAPGPPRSPWGPFISQAAIAF